MGLGIPSFKPCIDAAIGYRRRGVVAEVRRGILKNAVFGLAIGRSSVLVASYRRSGFDWMARHFTLLASGVGGFVSWVPDVGARKTHCDRRSAVHGIVTSGQEVRRDYLELQAAPEISLLMGKDEMSRYWFLRTQV